MQSLANPHFELESDGWLSGVNRVVSPNFNQRPVGIAPSLLVIHNISLPPGQFGGGYIEAFFSNSLDAHQHSYFTEIKDLQVSSHLLIDRDGAATQFVSLYDRAWHAGVSCFNGQHDCNNFSIGIELEGTDDTPYTEAQYQTLVQLTQTLMLHFPEIGPDTITGHSDIAPGRKTDPGPAFNWEYYKQQL